MPDSIVGPYLVRPYHRDDGGVTVEVFLADDLDRMVARMNVHERKGTKLWRRFDLSLLTRQDGRKRHKWWSARYVSGSAQVLR